MTHAQVTLKAFEFTVHLFREYAGMIGCTISRARNEATFQVYKHGRAVWRTGFEFSAFSGSSFNFQKKTGFPFRKSFLRILQLLGPILLPGGVTQLFLQFIDFANWPVLLSQLGGFFHQSFSTFARDGCLGWGGVWQCNEVRVHLRTPSSSIGRAVCRKLPTKTIFTFLRHDFQNTTFEVPDPRSNWKFKSTIAAFDGSSLRDLWCEAKNSCMFSV